MNRFTRSKSFSVFFSTETTLEGRGIGLWQVSAFPFVSVSKCRNGASDATGQGQHSCCGCPVLSPALGLGYQHRVACMTLLISGSPPPRRGLNLGWQTKSLFFVVFNFLIFHKIFDIFCCFFDDLFFFDGLCGILLLSFISCYLSLLSLSFI